MRFLKIVLAGLVTVLAMLASLAAAVFITFFGLVAYLFLRLGGRPARVRFGRRAPPPRPPAGGAGDVIDVTATEVTTKHLER